MFAYPFTEKFEHMMEQTGDFLEQKIGDHIRQSDMEAPVLSGMPEKKVWYKVPLEKGICGDGSPYHIYLKKGTRKRLCIFFSGGGVAWDDYSAARPVTGGKVAAGQPNFYWNNLRPFTQVMNINVGITQTGHSWNPFDSWCFIVVTYATGDFHVGNRDYEFDTGEGTRDVVHFKGHENFLEAMKVAKEHFPDPGRILIAGDSAGAFAVPALTEEILEDFYPDCRDVTLLSDSALLLFDHWQETARDIWGAGERFWKPISSDNIILDWYSSLVDRCGDRLRYLYASSVHDYLLSTFYNAVTNKDYSTNKELQELYRDQLAQLTVQLKKIMPGFGFFFNDWKHPVPGISAGGSVHTAVRKPYFHIKNDNQATMARWLFDAVNGRVYDVGMSYLRNQ
ncbi:MAG: pectin acetylesterase [Eubacterium sp.]|nr:pectin acetylesterase [Eubacterium sp.]